MSDGREERQEREMRIEQEKREDREDRIDRDEVDEGEPERVDSYIGDGGLDSRIPFPGRMPNGEQFQAHQFSAISIIKYFFFINLQVKLQIRLYNT